MRNILLQNAHYIRENPRFAVTVRGNCVVSLRSEQKVFRKVYVGLRRCRVARSEDNSVSGFKRRLARRHNRGNRRAALLRQAKGAVFKLRKTLAECVKREYIDVNRLVITGINLMKLHRLVKDNIARNKRINAVVRSNSDCSAAHIHHLPKVVAFALKIEVRAVVRVYQRNYRFNGYSFFYL